MSHTGRWRLLTLLLIAPPSSATAEDKNILQAFDEWIKSIQKPRPPEPVVDKSSKNVITLNPLALQYQMLGIEYERGLFEKVSVFIAPQAAYGFAGSNYTLSLGGSAGFRFFFLGRAPGGIFIGPDASVSYERRRQGGVVSSGMGIGLGATVGWTLIFFDRFTLSVGFGAQYRSAPDLEHPDGPTPVTTFSPLPRFAFGVAF